jgi:hypothetical protein
MTTDFGSYSVIDGCLISLSVGDRGLSIHISTLTLAFEG